jgi:hypothetical protein
MLFGYLLQQCTLYATFPFMLVFLVQQSLQQIIMDNLDFILQKSPDYYSNWLNLTSVLLQSGWRQHHLDWWRISILREILEAITVMVDSSVHPQNETGFYLIIVHKGENCSHA